MSVFEAEQMLVFRSSYGFIQEVKEYKTVIMAREARRNNCIQGIHYLALSAAAGELVETEV